MSCLLKFHVCVLCDELKVAKRLRTWAIDLNSVFQSCLHSLHIILIKHLNFLNSCFLIWKVGNNNNHGVYERIKCDNSDKFVYKFGFYFYWESRRELYFIVVGNSTSHSECVLLLIDHASSQWVPLLPAHCGSRLYFDTAIHA